MLKSKKCFRKFLGNKGEHKDKFEKYFREIKRKFEKIFVRRLIEL